MRSKKLDDSYVAGYLRNRGGFFIASRTFRQNHLVKSPRYRVEIAESNESELFELGAIFEYLQFKHQISSLILSHGTHQCFYITKLWSVAALIKFFEDNGCVKKNQNACKHLLQIKCKCGHARVDHYSKYRRKQNCARCKCGKFLPKIPWGETNVRSA